MPRFARLQFAAISSRLSAIWPSAKAVGRALVDLALPPRCLECEGELPARTELLLCENCSQAIAPPLPACCSRCGAVLAEGAWQGGSCWACKDFSLNFDAVFPLGRYEGPLREMVLRTKRLSGETVSSALGRLMAQRLGGRLAEFAPRAVMPVPMHWAKRLMRGVNSTEVLADCLGRRLGAPVVPSLVRSRYTGPQKDLLPRERFRNVRGAFRLRRLDRRRWQGERLLLVDDILTTGATCSEIARLLKQAGAAAVGVAVVARAHGP